jgi:glycosyltransferase involved in cell wall biosynthesis
LPKTTSLWWEQIQVARWLFHRRPEIWVAPKNYGVPVARPRGTSALLVVLDLIPLVSPSTYLRPRPLWAAMYLASTALSLLRADLILSISDHTASDVRRFSRRRSRVIYPPLPARLVERAQAPPISGPYVLYNGGFDPRKNVDRMLDGFAAFRLTRQGDGAVLVVLGDRADMARAMLAEHGLTQVSVVTGFVSETEKWDYLANALAVLYPSSYEGFGLVLTEAFAAGTPVVSGTGGALSEVGGDAAIFVEPASVSSIVSGLCAACDPVSRSRAVMAGYEQLEHLQRRSGGYADAVRSLLASQRANRLGATASGPRSSRRAGRC